MNEQLKTIEIVQRSAIELAIQFGPRVLAALLILLIGFYVGRWAGRAGDQLLVKVGLEQTLRQTLVRFLRVLVLGLFGIMALQNLGVELLPLLAGLGLAGAGLALAMQGVLGNLVAGLTIIFTRPFRLGEYISIGAEAGKVEDISLFSTVLSHADLSRVVIPNRKIVGEILHNFGKLRQLNVLVNVAYGTDIKLAQQTIAGLLAAHPGVLQQPEPVVSVEALRESGVLLAIRPWTSVEDFGPVSSAITQAVLEAFRERGIAMPPPQREVRMLGPL
jgi:small conductance mechanosensitive channel